MTAPPDSPFILVNELTQEVYPLPANDDVVIGRSRSNDIVLQDASVTRRHTRLRIIRSSIEVVDGGSSNGTYVAGRRVDAAPVRVGDEIRIGGQRLTVRLAPWVSDEPPEPLIVVPADGQIVEHAWRERAVGWAQNDELWAALYLRWRRAVTATPAHLDAEPWVIRAAAWMCSAPMLQYLRRLLARDDAVLWFVGEAYTVIDALLNAAHGIGPLLVLDIVHQRDDRFRTEYAWESLEAQASVEGTDVATWVLRRVPQRATSVMGLIGTVFERSFIARSRWQAVEFLDFMERPSFAEAAEGVVFVLRDSSGQVLTTFRALEEDLITLESTVELRAGQTVEVADPQHLSAEDRAAWVEHLADFEVVQPFVQFGQ
jgi:hypothetical protein